MIMNGARVGEACGLTLGSLCIWTKESPGYIRKVSWDQRSKAPYLEERVKSKVFISE